MLAWDNYRSESTTSKWKLPFNADFAPVSSPTCALLELTDFLDEAETVFVREIQRVLQTENTVRVYVLLKSDYVKASDDDADTKSFNTKSADIFRSTDLREWFNEHVHVPLLHDVEEFQDRDSGWTLLNVLNLTLHINKYNPTSQFVRTAP